MLYWSKKYPWLFNSKMYSLTYLKFIRITSTICLHLASFITNTEHIFCIDFPILIFLSSDFIRIYLSVIHVDIKLCQFPCLSDIQRHRLISNNLFTWHTLDWSGSMPAPYRTRHPTRAYIKYKYSKTECLEWQWTHRGTSKIPQFTEA